MTRLKQLYHPAGPWRQALLLALAAGSLGLTGCLGALTLVITPDIVVVQPGGAVAFSATTAAGTAVPGVSWTVTAGDGTIDATTGVYTAPLAGVTTVVTATVQATKGTSTGSATVVIQPPLTAEVADPVADDFGSGTYDIRTFATSRTDTTLTVTISFDVVPTLPVAGAAAAGTDLAGFIDFDLDESFATGANSANSTWCPSFPISAIGSDAFVSLFQRNVSGNYDIIDTATLNDIGDASVTVSGVTVTLVIPFTELANDDGSLKFTTVLGDAGGSTDCTPDEGAGVATSEGMGGGLAPELTVVGDPHESYLTNISFGTWQTPSSTL